MSCEKCTEKFVLENRAVKIFFISDVAELEAKLKIFLMKLGFDLEKLHDLTYLEVENEKEFFTENIDAFATNFNELETQKIKLYVQDTCANFNLQALLSAKPMQRYINLFQDKEFFDIVNNESLTSYFQPIVNANDNSIYGYEALIRGVKANGKLMYPNELFDKSSRNDLDFKLDRLCRESALKTAAVKKIQQKVFINFIPTSIYDPEFCLNSTVKWANQLEFDSKNIVFEVVETQNVKDQVHLKEILMYYREKGYKIALDDVGEGYSSLNMLIKLKPDIIKIDRNIIENINEDEFKQSVYKALYTVAKENNIEVLAEGIETPYEIETIRKIGVDYMQGFYFAKPTAEPLRTL